MSDFTYTGAVQTETIADSGNYAVTLYGAAGGSETANACVCFSTLRLTKRRHRARNKSSLLEKFE